MITKIHIKNNKNTDRWYLKNIKAFKNGAEFTFTDGVNILVGENGCGKTTLINLIKDYLAVNGEQCGRGTFGRVINRIIKPFIEGEEQMHDGVDVFADYELNTFCYTPWAERDNDDFMLEGKYGEIALTMEGNALSKGQSATFALSTLFQKIFSKDAQLKFDYQGVFGGHTAYMNYIKEHKVKGDERVWTILMDEPDSSVDIDHIIELYDILSYKKEHTQIICVIHNPFLIAKLADVKDVNMIEMSRGYVKKIKKEVEKFQKL